MIVFSRARKQITPLPASCDLAAGVGVRCGESRQEKHVRMDYGSVCTAVVFTRIRLSPGVQDA